MPTYYVITRNAHHHTDQEWVGLYRFGDGTTQAFWTKELVIKQEFPTRTAAQSFADRYGLKKPYEIAGIVRGGS